ncbi:hypothetical protein GCM10025868_04150 [Angustibacter aerolatus]|uniref:Uncharacterized protein n=1 Tax=Angustibacter aerolatus TaxID=1162965 RepID=A0ABQ6JEB3_9ACTN|nr:hypothetical protein [Angustibacter aerolatus]GMA85165.1 hypothetical protein GCM10025868_04150 [Angustibacter aerolatus]
MTTVLDVLEVHGSTVRAAFAAIEPTAQQRLVGLVFERERALLRERRGTAAPVDDATPPAQAGTTSPAEPDGPLAEVRSLVSRRRP